MHTIWQQFGGNFKFSGKKSLPKKDAWNKPCSTTTSRSWRRSTRATRCVTRIVLYTKVDAQCLKLMLIVAAAKLTTLLMIDVPW